MLACLVLWIRPSSLQGPGCCRGDMLVHPGSLAQRLSGQCSRPTWRVQALHAAAHLLADTAAPAVRRGPKAKGISYHLPCPSAPPSPEAHCPQRGKHHQPGSETLPCVQRGEGQEAGRRQGSAGRRVPPQPHPAQGAHAAQQPPCCPHPSPAVGPVPCCTTLICLAYVCAARLL